MLYLGVISAWQSLKSEFPCPAWVAASFYSFGLPAAVGKLSSNCLHVLPSFLSAHDLGAVQRPLHGATLSQGLALSYWITEELICPQAECHQLLAWHSMVLTASWLHSSSRLVMGYFWFALVSNDMNRAEILGGDSALDH